ncbi:polyribonucleotide nucleotidyltransferase [Anaerotruncus sp. 1XD42-93]|uniref:polyribonucleotide nucleotidyltransferase n=1 Tax=Anaerotruncus sp. 1XD42-93 TaxID=2320853 RepID=UPI000EA39C1E|nr:polyribonucleotide nucleotidyltransferase [Anaerotruncus sp. 1XD42-93]NBK18903.1 polyribonucleotide nucleotidyltransferase [Anaerotruncus sp. 1XD42-93]RKJ83392.1 polyribonucleotide nucleotidyltransferase [Anaerotruncus sp. 1XD22-93]
MFENFKIYETTFGGRPMTFETGKMCGLSNGSVLVRWGETVVLVNVTASAKPREGIDFFPLSVDFEEKLYSVGKIPGSFIKRESRPSDKAILASRLVDRPIRPLFPKDMRNDCSVVMTVMSVDPDCLPEIAGMIGTSFALSISDIPWNGPIAGANIGLVNGEIIVCPDAEQRRMSDLNLTVAANEDVICMIEAGANEVSNEVMLDAIIKGHEEIKKMVRFIKQVQAEIGKPKFTFESMEVPHDLFDEVEAFCAEDVKFALDTDNKVIRDERLAPIVDRVHAAFDEKTENPAVLDEVLYKLQKKIVRRWLLDEQKRVDGRKMDEIRPLAAEVSLLPRVHGSGMFTRGQTQVLTIATLGTISEAQKLDGIDDQEQKRYIHHYNFPSYSVGETRPSRGPGRREIGHGALAERALEPVIPSVEEFPYTIRLVSEVLSSNGSTSQGSICGSTLALMDAGVPIKEPVAGISCGLITEGDRWMTMVDIQGLEDFFGDMDFKVGGTKNGITAIQMDLKIDGLTYDMIKEAFEKTYTARMYILNEIMLKAIPEVRPELSKYAPKVQSIRIHPDKIREVIGSGGKVIQKISADCGVKIDIDDDGTVVVSSTSADGIRRAISIIETIVNDPEVGAIYKGKVTRLMNFGAFVELAPGKEGLVHISKLDMGRVEKVEDVVAVGDEVIVKVTEIDQQGRINLSRRDALLAMEAKKHNR